MVIPDNQVCEVCNVETATNGLDLRTDPPYENEVLWWVCEECYKDYFVEIDVE